MKRSIIVYALLALATVSCGTLGQYSDSMMFQDGIYYKPTPAKSSKIKTTEQICERAMMQNNVQSAPDTLVICIDDSFSYTYPWLNHSWAFWSVPMVRHWHYGYYNPWYYGYGFYNPWYYDPWYYTPWYYDSWYYPSYHYHHYYPHYHNNNVVYTPRTTSGPGVVRRSDSFAGSSAVTRTTARTAGGVKSSVGRFDTSGSTPRYRTTSAGEPTRVPSTERGSSPVNQTRSSYERNSAPSAPVRTPSSSYGGTTRSSSSFGGGSHSGSSFGGSSHSGGGRR